MYVYEIVSRLSRFSLICIFLDYIFIIFIRCFTHFTHCVLGHSNGNCSRSCCHKTRATSEDDDCTHKHALSLFRALRSLALSISLWSNPRKSLSLSLVPYVSAHYYYYFYLYFTFVVGTLNISCLSSSLCFEPAKCEQSAGLGMDWRRERGRGWWQQFMLWSRTPPHIASHSPSLCVSASCSSSS